MKQMLRWIVAVTAFATLASCGDSSNSGDGTSVGGPDSVISVKDALAAPEGDRLRVRGSLLVDPTGARLCDALAESFPPQCVGGAVLGNFDEAVIPPDTQRSGDVRWVDQIELIVVREGSGLRVVEASPS